MGGTNSDVRAGEHPAVEQRITRRGQADVPDPAHHFGERRLLGQNGRHEVDLASLDGQEPSVGGKVGSDLAEIGDPGTLIGDEIHEQVVCNPGDPDPAVGGETLSHGPDAGERARRCLDPGADPGRPVLIRTAVHQ